MSVSHPWLEEPARQLQEYRRNNRIPHALLLKGPEGLAQLELARDFIQSLFCRDPGELGACENCTACRQFLGGNFADFHEVTFEEDDRGKLRKQIVVDQIRRLSADLGLMAGQGGWKIALIHPADAMNTNAANSLLKTLEEPPARSLLILVSHRPALLPATIRSRCQQFIIRPPEPADGAEWLRNKGTEDAEAALAYAGGSPGRARLLSESGFLARRKALLGDIQAVFTRRKGPVELAGELEKHALPDVVEWLEAMTEDMIRIHQLGDEARLRNPDLLNSLKTMAERLNLEAMHQYLAALRKARRLLNSQANPRLLLESLLLPWAQQLDDTVVDILLEG